MAITVTAGPTATASGGAAATTASFTPADGDLLVALTLVTWGDAPTVEDSLSGTWTQRAVSTGLTVVRIWTRPVVTGASMTVTVTPPFGGETAVAVYRAAGAAASPIGDDGAGNQEANAITPTILTSTAADSYAFVAGAETWDTGGNPTSSDLTYGVLDVGQYLLHGYKALGTAGTETANLDAYGTGDTLWCWCALEILNGETPVTGALALTATLAGGAVVTHPATGPLALTATLTGGVTANHAVTGALAVAVALAGGAVAEHVTSGPLSLTAALAGGAVAEHPATGPLALTATLSGSCTAAHVTGGDLASSCALAGGVVAEHVTGGPLAAVCALAGGAIVEHPATGPLALTCTLSGDATTGSAATGALSLTATLAGGAVAEHAVTGAVAVTVALAGDAFAGPAITGDLSVSVALAGSVVAAHVTGGDLASSCALAGGVVAEHVTGGPLALTATMAGSASNALAVNGGLDLTSLLLGVVTLDLPATGEPITETCTLTGGVIAEHVTGGALSLTAALAGDAVAGGTITGALTVTGALAGGATAQHVTGGALSLTATLAGGAVAEHAVTGAVAVTVAMTGIGSPAHYATGSGGAVGGGAGRIVKSRARTAFQPGQRRWAFRYELLDQDNQWVADLTSVVSCTVTQDWLADIKRKARIVLQESDDIIDWMSERIRPWVRLHLPPYGDDDWVEWPVGVFLLSSPTRSTDGTDAVTRDVTGYDLLQVLADDKVQARYCVTAGTAYTTAVVTLLGGMQAVVAASASTMPIDREWAPGTTKLRIINDLLGAINYQSLSFDEYGRAVVAPYVLPSARAEEYTYADDDTSLIVPKVDQELDLYDVPNSWTLVVSNADRAALSASYVNQDPASPTSTVRRGRTITDFRTEQDAADQTALDAKVERLAHEASQVYEHLSFSTGLNPLHSGNDVYRITYRPLGINSPFAETSWSMTLKAGAPMTHKARRVVSVAGGGS